MKNCVKSGFMGILVLILLIPINAFTQNKPLYLAVKPGIYSPQSSDLEDFDTGFNGELALGIRFNPNFAGEIGIGYFYTENEETFVGVYGGLPYREVDKYSIDVYPITFTLKAILPYQNLEFFGLGGIGAYIVSGELEASGIILGSSFDIDAEDTKTVLGGFLGGGFHYNITPALFLGVETKYLWTGKVTLEEQIFGVPLEAEFKMDGLVVTGVIGFKF